MFPNSTQAKYWMFENEEAINKLRSETNGEYVLRHQSELPHGQDGPYFLSAGEEADIVYYFAVKLEEFCRKFKPPMPRYVKGTAFHYYKRFFLHNSVMNHHPKEILVTAVYLASKVEEFNVSMQQFVVNVSGNQERATKIILNNELLLMQELHFHLTVHNPFRAVEGLLIDIKTRCSSIKPQEVEGLRGELDTFLDKVFLTDAPLIYAPSQIALAAIIHAASVVKQNLDHYVTQVLLGGQGEAAIPHIISCVRNIRVMVKNMAQPLPTEELKSLALRLDTCRNAENDPDSLVYKRKLECLVDEDDVMASSLSGLEGSAAKQPRLDSTGSSVGLRALSPGLT